MSDCISFVGKVNVLDSGSCELWDFSNSTRSYKCIKETVANVATLSRKTKPKDIDKTVNFLIQHKHLSPFEFIRYATKDKCTIEYSYRNNMFKPKKFKNYNKYISVFKLTVPIFVLRQLIRHRSNSYLELSGRYSSLLHSYYTPYSEDCKLSVSSKLYKWYQNLIDNIDETYRNLLRNSVKKEIARLILPVSAYTQVWLQSDYISFRNMVLERLSVYAQQETANYIKAMISLLIAFQPEFEGLYLYNHKGKRISFLNMLSTDKDIHIDISKSLHASKNSMLSTYKYIAVFSGKEARFIDTYIRG